MQSHIMKGLFAHDGRYVFVLNPVFGLPNILSHKNTTQRPNFLRLHVTLFTLFHLQLSSSFASLIIRDSDTNNSAELMQGNNAA